MNKLNALQTRLDSRGVRDIKLFIDPTAPKISRSELGSQVIVILTAHLDGRSVKLAPIGDRLLTRTHTIK